MYEVFVKLTTRFWGMIYFNKPENEEVPKQAYKDETTHFEPPEMKTCNTNAEKWRKINR